MLLETITEKYQGKTLSHFEDEHGQRLKSLYMLEGLHIVFTDGSKIKLAQDWRGMDCYWSQKSDL